MPVIPDSLLAIDIETASPFRSPHEGGFDNTACFELVAVGLGYQRSPGGPIISDVLFRQGGWESSWTAALLSDVIRWCDQFDADALLTYNGQNFDEIHLKHWAHELTQRGQLDQGAEAIERLFSTHIDLNSIGITRYAERLESWRTAIKLERLCEWEGIPTSETYYEKYDLEGLLTDAAIDEPFVTNAHIGEVLGERFVNALETTSNPATGQQELKQLLYDYTIADIDPLFALANRFRTN